MNYVTGSIRGILRLEGLIVFLGAILLYHRLGFSWWVFVAGFLAPDISLLGYMAGKKLGAAAYNAAHTYVGAIALALAGALLSLDWPTIAGIIWISHIGIDRALGFGLKLPEGGSHTHLGPIGRQADTSPDRSS